jgi:tripartite-type tricarboxylate transporter receptor subunit TctC
MKNWTGKTLAAAAAMATTIVTAGLLPATGAHAQNYPSRPVKLIVPLAAGGSTDIIGRTMAAKLMEYWNGNVVLVENRTGGATIIGTDAVAKAAPDGYTMLLTPAPLAVNATLFAGKLPYDTLKDFAPVILINTSPLVLVVNPDVPAKSVKELIALARAQQGKMNYGSSTVGGSGHLSAELLNMMGEVKTQHIPYKGNAPALTDLMAGRVSFLFNGTTSVLSLIQAGKVRPLGVTSLTRVSVLPDVPTMDEAGLKGFFATAWNGINVPARTPAAVIAKINADANRAIQSTEMSTRLKNDGSDAGGGTPQQYDTFMREEMAKWAKVIKIANIQAE